MKARIIIDSAPMGPADIKLARTAFDRAWATIAHEHTSLATASAARERLARIVLSLVPDTKDASEIQVIALHEMLKVH